ncbi:aminotransferase class V-fold PLP-dependent enzyme [Candidatus Micrarchaeota archaeon]|nr:aminotransferase class V-fold PLP-dependent enzyme [Candidatus Micrarchaeota archaeon]
MISESELERIRSDFPILKNGVGGKPIIYFDSGCVSLRPRQVMHAMNEYYEEYPACAGRSIHKLGKKVSDKLAEARRTFAKFLGARKAEEVIFTRNTTEGINLVAHSLKFSKGDVVITSDREHNSNLLPWQLLSKRSGVEHKIVYSTDNMEFDLEKFKEMMNDNVKLVSLVHSSNLDGYTLPAAEIVKIAHENGSLVMLDGAQSAPHRQVDVRKLDVDFFALSGHKMLGPAGTGVLYGKCELLEEMEPFMLGGDTVQNSTYNSYVLLKPPEKFEAGLQNYAGSIGLAEAARYIEKVGKEKIEKHEHELNKLISERLLKIKSASIIGPKQVELRSGVVSFNIEGMNFHDVAVMLDENNIMVRSGQHCVHSWFNAHNIPGCVRASLYLYNTIDEAGKFLDVLAGIARLR